MPGPTSQQSGLILRVGCVRRDRKGGKRGSAALPEGQGRGLDAALPAITPSRGASYIPLTCCRKCHFRRTSGRSGCAVSSGDHNMYSVNKR